MHPEHNGHMAKNSLRDERVQTVLQRLYQSARQDKFGYLRMSSQLFAEVLRGNWTAARIMSPALAKDIYMPIGPSQGSFIYQTARAIGAKNAVEFGSSFGISTIYLASAVRDNGGHAVIGTEIEPSKREHALQNLADAGFADIADIRLGDALTSLRETPEPIDLVFMDGWKDVYMPLLQLLQPRLRVGSVVLADDIHLFRGTLRPYVNYVQAHASGFESTTLPIGEGLEYSVYVGHNGAGGA